MSTMQQRRLLLPVRPSLGQVLPDAVSHGAGTSPSWTHTCVGNNVGLLVSIGDFNASDVEATSGITCDGTPLILLGTHAYNTARVSLWYLFGVSSGAHTIAVTSATSIACVAHSYAGAVSLGTPVTNIDSSGTPASGLIVGGVRSILIAFTGNLTDDLTEGVGQTLVDRATSGGFHCDVAYKFGTGGVTTFNWSGYVSDTRSASLAIEIKPGV